MHRIHNGYNFNEYQVFEKGIRYFDVQNIFTIMNLKLIRIIKIYNSARKPSYELYWYISDVHRGCKINEPIMKHKDDHF